MSCKRFLVVGSVVLILLFLIVAIGIIGRYRCQRMGIFRVLNAKINYNMTMQELESQLGNPEELIDKGNGCIVLRYNLSTRYEVPAEVHFLFSGGNHKLSQVLVKIRADTAQESTMLLQQIRDDLISEYEGPFFHYQQGSLDSEIIGVDLLIAKNYVELTNEGNTIVFSGWFY